MKQYHKPFLFRENLPQTFFLIMVKQEINNLEKILQNPYVIEINDTLLG